MKLVEQTYSLKPEDIPTLLAHIALLREVAERPVEENRKVLEESNQEIAEETLKPVFEAPKKEPEAPVTDKEIEDFDRENYDAVMALNEERREAMKKYMQQRMKDIGKRIDKVEK